MAQMVVVVRAVAALVVRVAITVEAAWSLARVCHSVPVNHVVLMVAERYAGSVQQALFAVLMEPVLSGAHAHRSAMERNVGPMDAVESVVTVRTESVVNTMVPVWRPPDARPSVTVRTVDLTVAAGFVGGVPPG